MKHSNLYLGLVLPSGGWQSFTDPGKTRNTYLIATNALAYLQTVEFRANLSLNRPCKHRRRTPDSQSWNPGFKFGRKKVLWRFKFTESHSKQRDSSAQIQIVLTNRIGSVSFARKTFDRQTFDRHSEGALVDNSLLCPSSKCLSAKWFLARTSCFK